MTERDEERQRRREVGCPLPTPTPHQLDVPAGRPTQPCGDAVEPLADQYAQPTPCPDVTIPPSLLPDPLVLSNELATLTCAELGGGPHGDMVSVAYGTFTALVYFQHLDDITPERLDYLAGLTTAQRLTLTDANTTAEQAREITRLTLTQSQQLLDLIAAARLSVNTQADDYAQRLIDCGYLNAEQTATCDPVALTNPGPVGQEDRIYNPVAVASGLYRDTTQERADAQALAAANLLLRCLWGNAEVTRTCVDLGFPDAVPVDTELVGLAQQLRVGSVTVPALTYFSENSQEDADLQATSAAEGALSCFYLNTEVLLSCTDEGKPTAVVDPVTALSGASGNPVTIQAGYLLGFNGDAEVQAEAEALAAVLLDCYWLNANQTATCPPVLWEETEVAADPGSPRITATVEAGTVRSTISQADADEQALLQAELQLDCLYCNPLIAPVCVPADVIDPPVPIPSALVNGNWSIDATPGMAAGTYCGVDGLNILTFSQTIASTPVQPELSEGCTYVNDEVQAACVADSVVTVFVFADPDVRPDLSSYSRPNPLAATEAERRLIIPAGQYQVEDSDVPPDFEPGDPYRVKHYANQLAERAALSQLDCFFENNLQTASCDAETVEDPPGTFTPYPVHVDSITPVSIQAGTIRSYVSKEAANTEAYQLASAGLDCFWRNVEVERTCADVNPSDDGAYSAAAITTFVVEAGKIRSYDGQTSADSEAERLADSQLNCIYGSGGGAGGAGTNADACPEGEFPTGISFLAADSVQSSHSGAAAESVAVAMVNALQACSSNEGGLPGNDGAQTDCTSTCYGYYSPA